MEYLSQSRCGGGEFTPKEDNPVNEDNVAEEVQALSEQIEALTIQVWSLASGEQSTRGQKAPSGKEIASHQANLPARKQRAGVAAKGRRVVARKTQLRGKIRPTCLREDAPLGDCLGQCRCARRQRAGGAEREGKGAYCCA